MNNSDNSLYAAHADRATARKRVLLFTNSVAIGGMEEHVKLIARHLDREAFEVYSICPDWQATEPFYQSLGRVSDHIAKITPDRRHGARHLPKECLRLYHYLRMWNIEVLHMHSTTYRGQIFALLAARLAGVKRVYVTEHLAPEQDLSPIERAIRTLVSQAIDGIICVSEKNLLARSKHLYTPADRTLVVNNGVDLNDFPPIAPGILAALRAKHALPEDALIVGTAVRLEPEKGVNYLIDALPAIKAACPKAHLLIVGDGSLRASLEAQVAQLGLKESVVFTGFQRDPRPYLGLIDAFVLPVPVGSMSIGLLEAMAMRRAAVITFGGAGEAVVHGQSGFCAKPHSPASIAEYVIQLLQDSSLRKAIGDAAHRRVADAFSAQQVARALGQLYSSANSTQGDTTV